MLAQNGNLGMGFEALALEAEVLSSSEALSSSDESAEALWRAVREHPEKLQADMQAAWDKEQISKTEPA